MPGSAGGAGGSGLQTALVVGAGPAGSSTALLLARAGFGVTLLDRARFPRDKACGGGLTPRGTAALERLGVDTHDPRFVEVRAIQLSGTTAAFPATSRFEPRGLVARRIDLDAMLVELALKAGVRVRDATRVAAPILEDGVCLGVRLESGEVLEAHVTIAADGASSTLATAAGLAPPSPSAGGFWYAAMRGYFSGVEPADALEFYPLRTESGRWLPGYGWVFPLPGGDANVGVDLPHRPRLGAAPPLRDAYGRFVSWLRTHRPGFRDAAAEGRPVGALLPEAMSGMRAAMPGLLAVGDAAGLVTPYSGEGIVYALESAELACAAVLDGSSAAGYARALEDAYRFHFAAALAFMKGVRRAPLAALAARMAIGRPRVLRAAVRVMANLIEDDPSAPRSTVSRMYLAARRASARL